MVGGWEAFGEVPSLAPRHSERLSRCQWWLTLDRRLVDRMPAQGLCLRCGLSVLKVLQRPEGLGLAGVCLRPVSPPALPD